MGKAPFDTETLTRLTAEILCGLQHLHSLKIIHRDLKPSNILLNNAGHAKIADFSLSVMGVTKEHRVKAYAGTVTYMAPEVFNRSPYYAPADYYSLGMIVYEMAVGNHPFYIKGMKRKDLAEMMYTMRPYFPKDMDLDTYEFIHRLLCREQEVRGYLVSNLRMHPFFKEIDWAELERLSRQPRESAPILEEPLEEVIEVDEFLSPDTFSEDKKLPITSVTTEREEALLSSSTEENEPSMVSAISDGEDTPLASSNEENKPSMVPAISEGKDAPLASSTKENKPFMFLAISEGKDAPLASFTGKNQFPWLQPSVRARTLHWLHSLGKTNLPWLQPSVRARTLHWLHPLGKTNLPWLQSPMRARHQTMMTRHTNLP
ncbi:unnamed protein product [Staurois parvus]|uniref:Protein kinase domain-containing protein n=1 Tax=Staurois parvus TaxID=386267 RepID=A0ABN9F8L6_9NEOB|nr:unnamed protein product [Staurois parvus]